MLWTHTSVLRSLTLVTLTSRLASSFSALVVPTVARLPLLLSRPMSTRRLIRPQALPDLLSGEALLSRPQLLVLLPSLLTPETPG